MKPAEECVGESWGLLQKGNVYVLLVPTQVFTRFSGFISQSKYTQAGLMRGSAVESGNVSALSAGSGGFEVGLFPPLYVSDL